MENFYGEVDFYEAFFWEFFSFSEKLFKLWQKSRSSHRICSVEKVFLENFAKLTVKHLCIVSLF